MTRKHALFLPLLLLMAACVAMGQLTFNQKAEGGYRIAEGALSTVSILLNSHKIGSADAENLVKQIDIGKHGIDIARDIHATDPQGGDAKLAATITALKALEAYLASKETP